MIVRYAILSKTIEPPNVAALQQAYRATPGLTAADALIAAQGVSGIVVRGVTAEQALALQAGLKAQGMETDIVPESQLPALPPPRAVTSARFSPASLFLHDASGKETELRWEQVKLLAAGSVQEAQMQRKRTEWTETHINHIHVHGGIMIPIPVTKTHFEYRSRESDQWVLRAEIFGGEEMARFEIAAESFQFDCLGAQMSSNSRLNFCLLVRELAARAGGAARNRGVSAILAEPWDFEYYARKSGFQDELVWMLWRLRSQ